MLSDKLSSPPTLLRSPLHGDVKSRAGTPSSVATDKQSAMLRNSFGQLLWIVSGNGHLWELRRGSRKHEFIHPQWKKVFWRGNNAVKIIRRQGVSV